MTTPEATVARPLEGATPVARQSRFHGVRWLKTRVSTDFLEI